MPRDQEMAGQTIAGWALGNVCRNAFFGVFETQIFEKRFAVVMMKLRRKQGNKKIHPCKKYRNVSLESSVLLVYHWHKVRNFSGFQMIMVI